MNSFLQLYDEDTDRFVELYQDEVRRGVEDRVRTIHFISDLVELFFPKMADTATALMGGDVYNPDDNYFNISDESANLPKKQSPAPGEGNDHDIIR